MNTIDLYHGYLLGYGSHLNCHLYLDALLVYPKQTYLLKCMVFSIMNKERGKVQHALGTTNSKFPCCDLTAGG